MKAIAAIVSREIIFEFVGIGRGFGMASTLVDLVGVGGEVGFRPKGSSVIQGPYQPSPVGVVIN